MWGRHNPHSCSFKSSQCYKGKSTGHTKSQYDAVQQFLKRRKQQKQGAYYLEDGEMGDSSEEISHLGLVNAATLNCLGRSQPYEVELTLNATYEKSGNASQIQETEVHLETYSGSQISIQGQAQVNV